MKEIGWGNRPSLARTGRAMPPSFIMTWPRLAALGEIVAGDGNAQSIDAVAEPQQGQFRLAVGADGVFRIPALHGVEGESEVGGRAGQRAQMVERIDEGKRARAAQAAVGRLQP